MPSTKRENPISAVSSDARSKLFLFKAFFLASRPKTWPASLCPVLIGALMAPKISPFLLILPLFFSLLIQIGTNYANDYFDFMKGADTSDRKGPKRAAQSGWVLPIHVLFASFIAFSLSLLVALPLMIELGPWSFFLAALCVIFGLLYTAGPKPLGYLGLGEVLVFIFFGPIATCGAYFLQTNELSLPVFIASLAPGFLSSAILVANNLRDEISDRKASKKTLVVRFGKNFGSFEYASFILLSALIPLILVFFFDLSILTLLASLILIPGLSLIRRAFDFQDPSEVMLLLPTTSALLLIYTVLFCLAQ